MLSVFKKNKVAVTNEDLDGDTSTYTTAARSHLPRVVLFMLVAPSALLHPVVASR
jgi:hypothetical protein